MRKFLSSWKKVRPKPFQNLVRNLKRLSKDVLNFLIRRIAWKIFLKHFPKTRPTINLRLHIANTSPPRTQTHQHKIPRLKRPTKTIVHIDSLMTFLNKTVWLLNKKISSTPISKSFSPKYLTTRSMSISLSLTIKRSSTQLFTTGNSCLRVRKIQLQNQRNFSDKGPRVVVSHRNFTKV